MITDLQEDDEKRYTCHVENEAGFDRRDGELTVDIPPTPTRAVTLEREEGQTVMFFCDIQRGDQEHLVLQWKRFEKWLPMGVQVSLFVCLFVCLFSFTLYFHIHTDK